MILDLLAALIITYGFYRGYSKGMIKTVVDTLSIVVGLVIALKFSPFLIKYLQDVVNLNSSVEFILGFLIVFFLVLLIMRFIAKKLEALLDAVNLSFINQLAGGLIMGFLFAFMIGGFYLLLSKLKVLDDTYTAESTLYGHLINLTKEGGWILESFKNMFGEFWDKFMKTTQQIKENLEK